MRHQLMQQQTPRQSQVAASVALADVDNDQIYETKAIKTTGEPTTITGETQPNYADQLIIHYTREKRFQPFKRDMHEIFGNVYSNTPIRG